MHGGAVVVVEGLDDQIGGRPEAELGHGRLHVAPTFVVVQPDRHLGHVGVLAFGRRGRRRCRGGVAVVDVDAEAADPRGQQTRRGLMEKPVPQGIARLGGAVAPQQVDDLLHPDPPAVQSAGGAGTRQAPSMSKTWLNRPSASHDPTHRARSTNSSSVKFRWRRAQNSSSIRRWSVA